MLINAIAINLHKLFQDRRLTAITPLGELGGVMIMTVDLALVLVVAILCSKDCRTD